MAYGTSILAGYDNAILSRSINKKRKAIREQPIILGEKGTWAKVAYTASLLHHPKYRKQTIVYLTKSDWKPLKNAYFLTKPDDYFGKHEKRINMQKHFFHPCTFRHISRGRIHARIRRFSTFVFTSSPSLRKTLYVNELSVKVSPPFFLHPCLHRRFWKFIHYAHFMRNEVTKRPLRERGGRGRGGRIGE